MTSTRFALALSLILGIGGAVIACTDPASIDNDRTAGNLGAGKTDESGDSTDDDSTAEKDAGKATATKDAGKATAAKDAGKATTTDPGKTDPETDPGKTDPETDPGKTDPVKGTDGGTPSETKSDAGTDPEMMTDPEKPIMSVVPGSATKAKCSSYGKASGTMCAGYFCGVTQEQIAAEMPKDNICGENAVQGACDNKLPTVLAKCARDVKSANALDSNDKLRPKVKECVFKDAELKEKTPDACMDCFLDAAICAGDKCLVECLTGDSKGCDTCRAKNKCDAMVFTCAGLISPF